MKKDLKIALVHDFLVHYGGAERVLEVLCEMYPAAPIYTLLYDRRGMRGKFKDKDIRTSFLQKFPKFFRRRYKWLLPLMPTAPETFDLRDFDLVISSSGAWSKGIVTRLNTIHISYIHSPMRFVWDANEEYLRQQKKSRGINFISRMILNYIRVWDKVAADRPDYLIANSRYTQERIRKYYGRESVVIYPPCGNFEFRISNFESNPNDQNYKSQINSKFKIQNSKFFLIVSRLSPYKKIDTVVEAFNKLGLPLIVIGEGPQKKYLQSIANENVKILGWQPDKKIQEYYKNARAFIFAGVDDFGIAPVEAMSYGVPVLAIRKGGVLETVEEGKTGEFFDAATPEVIADCVRRFMEKENQYDKRVIMDRDKEFSKERFVREFKEYINSVVNS
ncbi:MAG: glycosyltransferase [Candidatus Moranbacteria bacterium]|nr:glycosyltransferase [Candidatus Moranbacteria bacterium]